MKLYKLVHNIIHLIITFVAIDLNIFHYFINNEIVSQNLENDKEL